MPKNDIRTLSVFEFNVGSLPCGAGGCGAAVIVPGDHRWEPGLHLDAVIH